MATSTIFSSESVTEGHPDKVCDTISDAVLDACFASDTSSRVACETMVKDNAVILGGEITTNSKFDYREIVKDVLVGMNYDSDYAKGTDYSYDCKFDAQSFFFMNLLGQQSPDIAQGVDEGAGMHAAQGAGDQGLMFGFACNETPSYMPLAIDLSHKLVAKHAAVRANNVVPHLRPDAKSQVTVQYVDNAPHRVDTVVLSTQHGPEWNERQSELREAIIEHVIKPVLGTWWHDDVTVHVNPTGKFEIGGPHGDCGLTGRKIIVDTYGGRGRHGGGAFSGKDPSKVDRSAAYMARYIAKNIVAAELADVCEVQLSYAIGVPEPTSVHVDCEGTARIDEGTIAGLIREHFDLTPAGIIGTLDLKRPIYRTTAAHGHFGRSPDEGGPGTFSWERTDKADALRAAASAAATA